MRALCFIYKRRDAVLYAVVPIYSAARLPATHRCAMSVCACARLLLLMLMLLCCSVFGEDVVDGSVPRDGVRPSSSSSRHGEDIRFGNGQRRKRRLSREFKRYGGGSWRDVDSQGSRCVHGCLCARVHTPRAL